MEKRATGCTVTEVGVRLRKHDIRVISTHPVIYYLARSCTYPGVDVNPGAAFWMNTADVGGPRGILRRNPGKQKAGGIEDKRPESSR